jgi:hypothetical protein
MGPTFVLFFSREGLTGVRSPEAASQAVAMTDMKFLQRIAPALQALDESIKKTERDFVAQNPDYEAELHKRADDERTEQEMLWVDFWRVHPDVPPFEANKNILSSAIKEAGMVLSPVALEWALVAQRDNLAV